MNILLCSYVFSPSVGGIETVSLTLAEEFTRLGHDVTVVTRSPAGPEGDGFPFRVARNPKAGPFLALMRRADVLFHNNISLQMFWPRLLIRKPWIIVHQTWLGPDDRPVTRQERMKRVALKFARHIAISRAVAAHIGLPSVVIGNPYQDALFRETPDVARDKDLVFLGRLVSDKGVEVLLRALARLAETGARPGLTLIGEGPEEASLKQQAQTLGLAAQVEFVGRRQGEELVRLLNAHRVMVVPSLWREPFGVVALEGIACGCVLIGSEQGGLKDAIGPCGRTFPNGDATALAEAIQSLLSAPDKSQAYRAEAAAHLAKHRAATVAQAYLDVFEAARNRAGVHRGFGKSAPDGIGGADS